MKDLIAGYKNGSSFVSIRSDGTRTVEYDKKLDLEYPLNIDIRVQSFCPLGLNTKTGKAVCSFCHESATTDGAECDYDMLKAVLKELPAGIELAIGCNSLTEAFIEFLQWNKDQGFISNVTVNQLTSCRGLGKLTGLIHGLGISFRTLKHPLAFVSYDNAVVHVIAGIDSVKDIKQLPARGVKKILVLGEKDFGFNSGNVNLSSEKHRQWYQQVRSLFDLFDVVSFDNLALEQLNVKRFIPDALWGEMYQHEFSFYINAVEGYFSPSSRSLQRSSFKPVKEYFHEISKKQSI